MKLTDKYRPKADRKLLRDLNDKAWKVRDAALRARLESSETKRIITAHVEALYPSADMEVLKRYGCARDRDSVTAHVQPTGSDRWDQWVSVPFAYSLTLPDTFSGLFCGGPWHSEADNWGLHEKTVAAVKAGTHEFIKSWGEYVADLLEGQRRRIPRELEPLLVEIADAKVAYAKEYKALMEAPALLKAECGEYPTWEQISQHFPTVGAEILQTARAA